MIRKVKVMAFTLFLTILDSNAEMDSDASSYLDYLSVDAIFGFKFNYQPGGKSGAFDWFDKTDRRFKAPECAGPYLVGKRLYWPC